jgi:hypothetical protein
MHDLGTFSSRAAELTRQSLAAKAQRDREFIALITLHLIVIVGGAGALIHLENHYARQDRADQEMITWAR